MRGKEFMPVPGPGGRDFADKDALDENGMAKFCMMCHKKMEEKTITRDNWSRSGAGRFTIRRFCPDTDECNSFLDYYFEKKQPRHGKTIIT